MRCRMLKTLSIVTILFTLLISTFQIGYADLQAPDTFVSAGGSGAIKSTPNSKGKGVWDHQYQGYRVTILDHSGEPAFTFYGKDYLDIVFTKNKIEAMDYFGNGNKYTIQGRKIVDDSTKCTGYIITVDDLVSLFKNGSAVSKFPDGGNQASAVSKLDDLCYHTTMRTQTKRDANGKIVYQLDDSGRQVLDKNRQPIPVKEVIWEKWGTRARDAFYGSGDKMDPSSILYLLLNMYVEGDGTISYFWKPKDGAYYITGEVSDSEKAALADGSLAPTTLMGRKGTIITIEPIVWNQLRVNSSKFSYGVYGTHTTIGGIVDWLHDNGYFTAANNLTEYGGYDWSLFGGVGRKSMVASGNNFGFYAYRNSDGTLVETKWKIEPPPKDKQNDNSYYITNEMVWQFQPAWSVQAYALGLNGDSTHTYDSDNYPTKKYTEHQAPDPTKDSWTKDNIASLTPDLRYNIVKFYEREVLAADGTTNKDIIHVSTHTRNKTLPKIEIQDEEEAGGYKVVEWKWSADPIPAIKDGKAEAGATKWTDEEIAELKVKGASTKDTRVGLVDITNKENGKEDKNTVTTLYVRLRKAIEFPETHTLDDPTPSNGNSGDEKSPGAAPDPLAPYENPDMPEEEKKQLVHNIVKVYETKTIDVDGTETLSLDGIYTRTNTAGIITIEEEGHLTGK